MKWPKLRRSKHDGKVHEKATSKKASHAEPAEREIATPGLALRPRNQGLVADGVDSTANVTQGNPQVPRPGHNEGQSSPATQTQNGGAVNAPSEPFHLESFGRSNVQPESDLARAQQELHDALEKLERVLREKRSSQGFMPDLQGVALTTTADLPNSFSGMVRDLQISNDISTKTIYAKIGHFMAALYPVAKVVLGLTGFVASNAACTPVSITANGLGQILDVAIKPHTKTQSVMDGLDILLGDRYLLQSLRQIPPEAVNENVLVHALRFQTAQTEFIREAVSWLRQNYVVKVAVTTVGLEKVDDAKAALQTARGDLRSSISDDLYLSVKRSILDGQDHEKLDVLCPFANHIVHLSKQRALHDDRLPDTGRSIVEAPAYHDWRDGNLSTLWCSGLGGAGKTFAASAVIDDLELRSGDIGLAYFYCEFDRRSTQDNSSLLAALTRQLLVRKPELCSLLPKSRAVLSSKEVEGLFVHAVRSFDAAFIVIDALDEFSEDASRRYNVAELLVSLQNRAGPELCRICITSRAAQNIFDVLADAQEVVVRASESEIHRFVQDAFEQDSHAKAMARQDQRLLRDVSAIIVTKSDRMWVELYGCSTNPTTADIVGSFKLASLQTEHAIRAFTPSDVRKTLETLTNDIDDYYQIAMDRIKAKPQKHREMVSRLLTWVFHAKSTLTLGLLSCALGFKRGDTDLSEPDQWVIPDLQYYVGASEGLLATHRIYNRRQYEGEMIACTLAHETVEAFLRNHITSLDADGSSTILRTSIGFHHAVAASKAQDALARLLSGYHYDPAFSSGAEVFWEICQYSDRYLLSDEDDAVFVSFWLAQFFGFTMTLGDYLPAAFDDDPAVMHMCHNYLNLLDSCMREHGSPPPLNLCAGRGWTSLCRLILEMGGDPNVLDRKHRTSLYNVLDRSRSDFDTVAGVIRLLLEDKNVDPNCSQSGVILPNVEALRLLLQRQDLDINKRHKRDATLLMQACHNHDEPSLELILSHPRLDPNQHGPGGRTALMIALDRTVELSRMIDLGRTMPLRTTGIESLQRFIKTLLNRDGLDLNARNASGHSALHIVVAASDHNFKESMFTPENLMHGVESGRIRIWLMETLVACPGINVNSIDDMRRTPLDYVVANQYAAARLCHDAETQCPSKSGTVLSDDPHVLLRWFRDYVVARTDGGEDDETSLDPQRWYSVTRNLHSVYSKMVRILLAVEARPNSPFELPLSKPFPNGESQ